MPVIQATQEAKIKEDCSSNPAWANNSRDYLKKKTHHKNRAGRVAQGVGPEFKPQYCKNKKGGGGGVWGFF
jgi:hypothetical protein